MPWIVKVGQQPTGLQGPGTGWDYGSNYFPRKFYYKKEALECKKEAESKGGKDITVTKEK